MFDNIETDHGGGEGVETQAVEARNLDDATVEPRAYVERTGDFEKAEAVQKEFTEVTANLERSAISRSVTMCTSSRPFVRYPVRRKFISDRQRLHPSSQSDKSDSCCGLP